MVPKLLLCLVVLTMGLASAQEARVKRSDVVFMGAKDAEVYDAYGATMVSWGGKAGTTKGAENWFKKRVATAHEQGLRYCAGLAFRTAFREMIDFDRDNFMDSVCRTLDGEPLLVPWLWDQKHKDGYPAYWFCTNAPGYREYLKDQARRAMVVDVEGLHIDDYAGTAGTEWRGGCFCRHCMAGFREYLRANVSAERLAECGVESLDDFDYGAFLKAKGFTVKDYRNKVGSTLPLGPEFLTFQYRSSAAWVGEVREYAEGLIGHPLMLSVNSSASNYKSLVIAPQLTYFCGEVPRDAAKLTVPTNSIFVFKVGDALDRPQVSTASGQDWAFVMEQSKPGLVRTWIAQAYAFGHQLMCPHRQWAYTKEKGTHWYQSKPEEYADLYQFVRKYADLFDGYDAIAKVGLVYSNAAFRQNKTATKQACIELARANVPFRLILAGDDWMDERLTAADIAGLDAIVVTEPLVLDDEQKAVLDAAGDKVVTWTGLDTLDEVLPRPITVEDGDEITVILRAIPDDGQAPFACHLVNRKYVGETDSMQKQTNVRLRFAASLFDGADIASATLYAPGAEPLQLALTKTADAWEIAVPELDLWGLVKLERNQ